MNQGKIWASGFYKAWGYLIDYPLPPLPPYLRSRTALSGRIVLTFFPVIGFLLGCVPLVLGTLGRLFFNPVAGALLFAVSVIVILIGKDSGRGISLFCSFIILRLYGIPAEDALKKMNGNAAALLNDARFSSALVFLVFLLGINFFLLGIGSAMSALPAVFAGDALIQAYLESGNTAENTASQLHCGTMNFPEAPGILIAVLFLIAQPKLGTLVILGAFLFYRRGIRKRRDENGGVSAEEITLGGFTAAVILLVLSLTILSFR